MKFWERVVKTETCWLWIGRVDHAGYGMANRAIRAHRWSYEQSVGLIPAGLVIDHLCRVRNCVRPDHMRVVTRAENVMAPGSLWPGALRAAQTHCQRGHEFTPGNTFFSTRNTRGCRQCRREWQKRSYRARYATKAMA